jgi:predicted dehydrogenase
MNKIRWGIVGPGKIAHQFAQDIKYTSNSVLAAVASNDAARSNSFAEKYGITKAYEGYEALFKDPEIDAIYVATTHNFHLQNSLDAIAAGKAVLCEKPLTDNPEDALKLIKAAQEQDVYLMEAMWTYFLPSIRKAKEWIEDGRIGEIVNLKVNFGFPKEFNPESRLFNPQLSGGVLLDMGIYPVAMAWLIMQEEPEEYNIVAEKAPTGVDYDVNMQLIYTDKRVANLHASFKIKLNNHCYIFGEKGYLDIPDFWRANKVLFYEEDELVDQFEDNREGLGFEFEIEAAAADILAGRTQSALMPHSYSIKLQELMSEIMKHF